MLGVSVSVVSKRCASLRVLATTTLDASVPLR